MRSSIVCSMPVVVSILFAGCTPDRPGAQKDLSQGPPVTSSVITDIPQAAAPGSGTTLAAPTLAAPKAIPAPADVAAAPADGLKTKSGLVTKVLTPGTGKDHPLPDDTARVHYTGWTKAGSMFDSSIARGEPAEFKVNQVIAGWTEGLQLMVAGEKRRLWIPAALAYGEGPSRGGTPVGDLVFDVELISIKTAPKPPPVPEDVKAAPATAKKTASGIAYRILKAGTGKVHPTATSNVSVHYSGWTPDGKMFDSSVVRGEPTNFGLNQVIPGWTEGVQLMVEGDKARFWIPGKLAYGDGPSRHGEPTGPLVFDIELLSMK